MLKVIVDVLCFMSGFTNGISIAEGEVHGHDEVESEAAADEVEECRVLKKSWGIQLYMQWKAEQKKNGY